MNKPFSGFESRHWRDYSIQHNEICCLWFIGCSHDIIGTAVLTGQTSAVSLPLDSIARAIVRLSATHLFMAHNHPSGDVRPSERDIAATRRVWRTARAVGASLQDHYIFGRSGCFSFRDNGLL